MEEGSLRCDANVSVMLKTDTKFGTKAEVKNVNSFRYIRAALEYEIERQIGVLEEGGRVVQESRLWNNAEGRTYSMRSKDQAHRLPLFSPSRILPPLIVGEAWMKNILAGMPELPEARRARLTAEYGLSGQDAATLTTDRELGDFFEEAAKLCQIHAKRVASILLSEITMRLRAAEITLDKSPTVSLDGVVLAADLTEGGAISSAQLQATARRLLRREAATLRLSTTVEQAAADYRQLCPRKR